MTAVPQSVSRIRSRRRLAAALLAAMPLGGCRSGDDGGNLTAAPAISITLSPTALSVVQGTANNITITVARIGAFSGDVSIAVSGLPTGVLVSSTTIPSGSTFATMTFVVATSAATGNSSVKISAGGTGVATVSTTLALTVTAPSGHDRAGANAPPD